MSERILMDRERQPDAAAFQASVGAAAPLWIELERLLVNVAGARGTCAWGGRSYGWEMRYTRAGRPLTSLAALGQGFVAQVVLGPAVVEEGRGQLLSERGRRAFEDASQYHDGRWIYLRVESRADLDDVLALLELKLPVRARAALEAAARVPVA